MTRGKGEEKEIKIFVYLKLKFLEYSREMSEWNALLCYVKWASTREREEEIEK